MTTTELIRLLPEDVRQHTLRVADGLHGDAHLVALLHDVVEDTEATLADLEVEPHVLAAVAAITRDPAETYFAYIERVRLVPLARLVKLADLEDHLGQVATLRPSLKKRYLKALELLK